MNYGRRDQKPTGADWWLITFFSVAIVAIIYVFKYLWLFWSETAGMPWWLALPMTGASSTVLIVIYGVIRTFIKK